ncbi:hypothetical protein A4A49_19283 [Nicotiana attenuata]|uniref:Uncharacterized protein n=1 Tax=Nicotiana attenuata TaxID=49451 RepID=A0A314KVE2_NICAT|nr:hypothetical protein A4A49_19283 [Nicotiana attenuata]
MGSYQFLRSHSDKLHNRNSSSSFCSETQRGCSKAQNCLLKILRTISTVPPQNTSTVPPSLCSQKLNRCNGFSIDLNIGFNVPPEMEESDSSSPVDGGWVSGQSTTSTTASGNFADEKSPFAAECGGVLTVDGECEKSCKSETCGIDAMINEEIIENFQLESNGVCETSKKQDEIGEVKEEEGFMGLLIEAATLIFGDFKHENSKTECENETERNSFKSENSREKTEDEENDKKQLKRRKECRDPVVRSKRGRIQVLPNKYKDSILEPFSRIRSTIFSNRRRSK